MNTSFERGNNRTDEWYTPKWLIDKILRGGVILIWILALRLRISTPQRRVLPRRLMDWRKSGSVGYG